MTKFRAVGEETLSNNDVKEGYPYEIVIFPLLTRLSRERLPIGTDLLLIVTSTADELSEGTNIDDFERPRNLKMILVNFFGDFRLRRTFKE